VKGRKKRKREVDEGRDDEKSRQRECLFPYPEVFPGGERGALLGGEKGGISGPRRYEPIDLVYDCPKEKVHSLSLIGHRGEMLNLGEQGILQSNADKGIRRGSFILTSGRPKFSRTRGLVLPRGVENKESGKGRGCPGGEVCVRHSSG